MSEEVLETLFEKGFNADVVLSVKGDERTLPVHRFILMAGSDYFKTQLAVKPKTDSLCLSVGEMSFETMQTMIRFIYTGYLRPEPTSFEETEKLLKASKKLDVKILVALRGPIARVWNVANICDFFNLYKHYHDDKEIINDLDQYLSKNLKEIRKEKSFLSLTMKWGLFPYVISLNPLNLSSEMDVFKTIELWINHDYPERHQHFPELLRWIRYSPKDPQRISIAFIMSDMLKWCICKESKLRLIHLMALMAGYKSKYCTIDMTCRKFI